MSQEIYKLTVFGETKWRCCNTTAGVISLDEKELEPLLPSLDDAVERLLLTEQFPTVADRESERQRLLDGYTDISNYLDGRFVLNLDEFFTTVERITEPEVASTLELSQAEVQYLSTVAVAIRQEVSGEKKWRLALPASMNDERRESVYSKLFPGFSREEGLLASPVLLEREAAALRRGFEYFDYLDGSREL